MTGVQILTFATYSEIYGHSLPFDSVCSQLRQFSRESVLYLCSYANNVLQLWDKREPNFDAIVLLYSKCFPRPLAMRLIAAYYTANPTMRRITFHRQQLLLLAKLAIKHCSGEGVDATVNTMIFGQLFLHANDQLHHGLIRNLGQSIGSPESLAVVLVETLAAVEYSYLQVPNLFVRARAMCIDIPPLLKGHRDHLDMELAFETEFGISLRFYQDLVFGVATRFGSNLARNLLYHPEQLPLYISHFIQTDIPKEKLASFLRIISGSTSEMASDPSLKRRDEGERSRWFSDLTVFRKFPLVDLHDRPEENEMRPRLLLDHLFLFGKVFSEPYFLGMKLSSGFSRFWGRVFECYVNSIMERAHQGASARYIANPKLHSSDNEELCDGAIVSGDTVVLLEYKSSIMRADCKYGGDAVLFLKELKNKYVFDEKDKNPKAAQQLAIAVSKLLNAHSIDWLDLRKIKRCQVLLVTLDSIGGSVGVSTILDHYFQEELRKHTVPIIMIDPLFCCDIEPIEMMSGAFTKVPLPVILRRWMEANPSRATPLSAFRMEDVLMSPPNWIRSAWDDFSEEAVGVIFKKAVRARKNAKEPLTFTFKTTG